MSGGYLRKQRYVHSMLACTTGNDLSEDIKMSCKTQRRPRMTFPPSSTFPPLARARTHTASCFFFSWISLHFSLSLACPCSVRALFIPPFRRAVSNPQTLVFLCVAPSFPSPPPIAKNALLFLTLEYLPIDPFFAFHAYTHRSHPVCTLHARLRARAFRVRLRRVHHMHALRAGPGRDGVSLPQKQGINPHCPLCFGFLLPSLRVPHRLNSP